MMLPPIIEEELKLEISSHQSLSLPRISQQAIQPDNMIPLQKKIRKRIVVVKKKTPDSQNLDQDAQIARLEAISEINGN